MSLVPIDEVVYFDVITTNPSTGAVSDADSTPTFDVYEEATDTGLLGATNLTKRTSLTGNYRGTFTASAANGFEAGKWYSVVASATVNSIAGKVVAMSFRCAPAESSAGVPKGDVSHLGGSAQSLTDLKDFADTGYDPSSHSVEQVNFVVNADVTVVNWGLATSGSGYPLVGVGELADGSVTAAAIANGAIDAATFASGALDAVWSTASRTLTAFGFTVSAQLADGVAHGGNSASLRLSTIQVDSTTQFSDAVTFLSSIDVLGGVTITGDGDAALYIEAGGATNAVQVEGKFIATDAANDIRGIKVSGTTQTLDALQTAQNTAHGNGSWETATSVTVSDKTGFKLASDGLDDISAPETAGRPTTAPGMWRRAWEWCTNLVKRDRSTGVETLYGADNTTVLETRTQSTTGDVDQISKGS